MLKKVHKWRGMKHFQYQALRCVLKQEGDTMKNLMLKYREVRVQVLRNKNLSIQYTYQAGEDMSNTMFMGTNSLSRKRSQ